MLPVHGCVVGHVERFVTNTNTNEKEVLRTGYSQYGTSLEILFLSELMSPLLSYKAERQRALLLDHQPGALWSMLLPECQVLQQTDPTRVHHN